LGGVLTFEDQLNIAPEFLVPGQEVPEDVLCRPIVHDGLVTLSFVVNAFDGGEQALF
jgi:hypothetical protein